MIMLDISGSFSKTYISIVAVIAQSVERIHGKDEVTSSILVNGSIFYSFLDLQNHIDTIKLIVLDIYHL
jgi:hypothetical protein